ncbi:MAG: RidA family protein [Gammaproteobacteria bacterium]|jgi:reactive intermediate/imine deaminase|nr:RidA family protein [Gammaproteobacteria bacterium]
MSGKKSAISTEHAPAAIGTYSQAVRVGDWVYLSGQIPLDPATMELIDGDIATQAEQVMRNLQAVAVAAGGSLDDFVKLTVFLLDLNHFQTINEVMAAHFTQPYPARAALGVAALPKGAQLEIEAIMVAPGGDR